MDFQQRLQQLISLGQEHIVDRLDQLQGESYQLLKQDIEALPLDLLSKLLDSLEAGHSQSQSQTVEPHPFHTIAQTSTEAQAKWQQQGLQLLSEGKVGALLVAGGQGSRLGYEGPKGAYVFGLQSGSSLFKLHAQRILSLSQQVGRPLPWAIMTSPQNHQATLKHFQDHDFFGLDRDQVEFFSQGVLPAISLEGKIILESDNQIQTAPDGNGGCFRAFHQSGIFDKWTKQGIESLFVFSVDNCLARPLDPTFIGFYQEQGALSASTVVKKAYPEERVGIFALKDKLPTVIEYSELTEEQVTASNDQGELLFDGGNMAIHIFAMKVLSEAGDTPLPYHKAIKKISYWDGSKMVNPTEPNACKFEQFMFDIFPRCQSMALMEVERSEWFAPIKNAEGKDSPESARELLWSLHKSWLSQSCGQELEGQFEISPLLSYAGENLPKSLSAIQDEPLILKA